MNQTFEYNETFVASHSCTLCSLLSNDKNAQECDAKGDDMKCKSLVHKK